MVDIQEVWEPKAAADGQDNLPAPKHHLDQPHHQAFDLDANLQEDLSRVVALAVEQLQELLCLLEHLLQFGDCDRHNV